MRGILIGVVAVLIPLSAHADTTPRVAVSVGMDGGRHEHPDDTGGTVGFGFAAELRLNIFRVGGSLGYDAYAMDGGAPVHASVLAGYAGVAVPVAKTAPGRARDIELEMLGTVEAGRHNYSVDGEESDFLGPTKTYVGNDSSIMFVGGRLGPELTIRHHGSSNALILKLEMIGRRDLADGTLRYTEVSCGGLFSSGCSEPSKDMTRVGGTELAVATSIGVLFGQ